MNAIQAPRNLPAAWSIFVVSLRGLLSGRRWLVVALLDGLFLALTVILATAGEHGRDQQYMVNLYRSLVLPIMLPFVCLLFASEAFGGEIEDRTLIYLTLRPVPSRAIILPKYLAAASISLAAVWLAVIPGFAILTRFDGGGRMLGGLLASTFLAVAAYCAVFLVLGLLVRRSLLVGVIYILFWEGAVAGLSRTAAQLSVRFYGLGVFSGILRRADLINPDDAGPTAARAAVVLLAVAIIAVALAARQLRRIELP